MLPPLIQTGPSRLSIVVMGCGRIGASIATALSEDGHSVRILDINPAAFGILAPGLVEEGAVQSMVGDGTLEEDLRRASAHDADVFIAAAGRDTHNALAAQLAKHILQVPNVICRVSDPTRREMYDELGLITVSATKLVTEMILESVRG